MLGAAYLKGAKNEKYKNKKESIMDTKEEIQQVQGIEGPTSKCDSCGITKSISDFDLFPTYWCPAGIHRYCRECRSVHLASYDSDLVIYLTNLFTDTKMAIDDPSHPNYASWGGLGTVDRFYSVDQFIGHVIDDLGYDSTEKLKGLTLGLIHSVCDDFWVGNIRLAVNADNKDVMYEIHATKFVSLKRSAPGRKEKQNGS